MFAIIRHPIPVGYEGFAANLFSLGGRIAEGN